MLSILTLSSGISHSLNLSSTSMLLAGIANTSLLCPLQDLLTCKYFYLSCLCGFVDDKFSTNSFISAQCAAGITAP